MDSEKTKEIVMTHPHSHDCKTITKKDFLSNYIQSLLIKNNMTQFLDLCKTSHYSPLLYTLLDENMAALETIFSENDCEESIYYDALMSYNIFRQQILQKHLSLCLRSGNSSLFTLMCECNAFKFSKNLTY